MNFPMPMFGLLAARQAHDSAADAGRIALVSMLVKPPMLGLMLAVVMAKQATPAPAVVVANATTSGTTTSRGALVLDQVAPETDLHSFLPSFIKYSKNQALEFAKELKLKAQFVEGEGASARSKQTGPRPGTSSPDPAGPPTGK